MSNSPDKNEVTTGPSKSELDLVTLKNTADGLGITYSPNIKAKSLADKIKIHHEQCVVSNVPVVVRIKPVPMTDQENRMQIIKEATKLVKVVITCMNPLKKAHTGEVFCASNKVVPPIKKYVPYNNEEGWLVPKIILNMIEERTCQLFKTVKRGDKEIRVGYNIPEFSIKYLPNLTEEGLSELKEQQAMANNLD